MEKSIAGATLTDRIAAEKGSLNREESDDARYADLVSLENTLSGEGSSAENAARAHSAAAALIRFSDLKITGQNNGEPVRDIMVDLMADMMHLWRALGVTHAEPFLSLVETAARHFEAEVDEELQGKIQQ